MVISIRNEQQQQFLYAFDVTAHIFLHKRRARPQTPVCFVCQLCRYRNDMLPLVIRKHIPNLRACHCATMCSSFLFQYIQPCLQIVKWQRSTVCHYTEKTPLLQVLYNFYKYMCFIALCIDCIVPILPMTLEKYAFWRLLWLWIV